MAVAHHTPAPVLVDQARTPGDEPLDLGLDRLRQHAPGTLAQYRQQRIIGNAHSWPRQPDNAILLHGVSFLVTLNITEDTPPPASATKSSHSSADGRASPRADHLARRQVEHRGQVKPCMDCSRVARAN